MQPASESILTVGYQFDRWHAIQYRISCIWEWSDGDESKYIFHDSPQRDNGFLTLSHLRHKIMRTPTISDITIDSYKHVRLRTTKNIWFNTYAFNQCGVEPDNNNITSINHYSIVHFEPLHWHFKWKDEDVSNHFLDKWELSHSDFRKEKQSPKQ